MIYNPYAGQVVARRRLEEVVDFLRSKGWSVEGREVSRPMEATEQARDAVKRGAEVVIAAGGDGTVNEVARGLVGTDTALGVLPLGTTNVWALQMGIPALNPLNPNTRFFKFLAGLEEKIARRVPANHYGKVLLRAANVLVEGRTIDVDVGEIDGRYFLMWVGIGLDATIIEHTSMKGKRISGAWAYVTPALWALRRYHSVDIRMDFGDGRVVNTNSPLIVISNIELYGGVFPVGARACVNDGELDVCIFKGEGFLTLLRHALKVLTRKHLKDSKVEYYRCAQLAIESARPLPVHTDGDPFMETPVTVRVVPSALKVIVPTDAPSHLLGNQAAV